jgi:hypothetical protein
MAIGFILVQVRSPMLVCVGMYLPLETTFAIFVGGVIRAILDRMAGTRGFNAAQKVRVENNGVLVAAGLIAGEALVGLVFGTLKYLEVPVPTLLQNPRFEISILVFILVAAVLIITPLRNAGLPDEPAPPSAMA